MDDNLSIKKGDLLKIYQKVVEGKKERITTFTGRVLKVKGSGEKTMFTVRQTMEGVEVDRIYPLHTPVISKIEKLVEKKRSSKKSKKSSPRKTSKSSKKK